MDNLYRYITHDGSAVLNVLDSTQMIRKMENNIDSLQSPPDKGGKR